MAPSREGGQRPPKRPGRCSASLLAGAAGRQRVVDLLALRADREPLRVPARHPYLAADRANGRPEDRALGDLVGVRVVRESLVIPVGRVDPEVLMNLEVALWKYFGAHET